MKKFVDYLKAGTTVKCLSYDEGVVSEITKKQDTEKIKQNKHDTTKQ